MLTAKADPNEATGIVSHTDIMTSISIKERIRALNLQSTSRGAPDSPSRQSGIDRQQQQQQLPSASIQTPLLAQPVSLQAAASPTPSDPSPSTKSPLRSSPTTSEKTQLFKAAKVIRKAFDSEAGPSFLDGSHSYSSQPSSPNSRQSVDDDYDGVFDFVGEEEMDATKALQSWRTKEKGSDYPFYHGGGNSTDEYHSTPVIASHPDTEIQNATADSAQEQNVSRNEFASNRLPANVGETEIIDIDTIEENLTRPMGTVASSEQKTNTPLREATDEPKYELKTSQFSMVGGEPYRAYARRSRLRSPKGLGTSLESNFVDMTDGAQSVTSAQSAFSQSSLSQISSLSTRATRFLKDKKDRRKEAAFLTTSGGNGEDAMNSKFNQLAKDIVQNTLRGEAYTAPILQNNEEISEFNELAKDFVQNTLRGEAYTAPILQNNEVDISEGDERLVNRLHREWKTSGIRGRPQKIDVRPSKPKMSDYISDLNRDVVFQDQHQAQLKHNERRSTPVHDKLQRNNSKNRMRAQQIEEDQSEHIFDPTASLDESSCSELKVMDLLDMYSKEGRNKKKQSHSESNYEFTAFQHGVGKSFDTGCQVLESMNPLPLIESALDALSAHNQTMGVFFSNARKSGVRDTKDDGDAPFDEDVIPPDEPICETVAIEVEYVEHGDESQSVAETDSVFSVSTRDLESYT